MTQRIHRPLDGTGRQLAPRRRERMILGPGPSDTRRFGTAPDPLAPPQPGWPTETRRVMQGLNPAAVTDRDHPAVGTACHVGGGLDLHDHRAVIAVDHIQDVDALDSEQFIGP